MLGNKEEGVEEEVSEALPQGGPPNEGASPDALGGAGGVEAQDLLVSKAREVLP